MSRTPASDWGRGPDEVLATLRRREWDDSSRLRARLLGERAFPIRIALGVPSGRQAVEDLSRFRRWLDEWRAFPHPERVLWEARGLHRLGEQRLPVALVIGSMRELAALLGGSALARLRSWEPRLEPLLRLADTGRRPLVYRALVREIERIERLPEDEVALLARVVPQLKPGMGAGTYLRALPLDGVHTKFVEDHETLVTALLDSLHDGAVTAMGGLRAWLGCRDNPGGWLVVRPLCEATRSALGNLPILQLPQARLAAHALPARRILVIENLQSGLALPEAVDTIAVAGTGRNLAWLAASWLTDRRVGYWGDVDSWGLQMLGEARARCPHLEALMMDRTTLEAHRERSVPEPESCALAGGTLTSEERALFDVLGAGGAFRRLEQEKLSADWIQSALESWLDGREAGSTA